MTTISLIYKNLHNIYNLKEYIKSSYFNINGIVYDYHKGELGHLTINFSNVLSETDKNDIFDIINNYTNPSIPQLERIEVINSHRLIYNSETYITSNTFIYKGISQDDPIQKIVFISRLNPSNFYDPLLEDDSNEDTFKYYIRVTDITNGDVILGSGVYTNKNFIKNEILINNLSENECILSIQCKKDTSGSDMELNYISVVYN